MWKTRNLLTFPSFPHNNVILFLLEGKVYTFPAKSKTNLYTSPAKCILFLLSVKGIQFPRVVPRAEHSRTQGTTHGNCIFSLVFSYEVVFFFIITELNPFFTQTHG